MSMFEQCLPYKDLRMEKDLTCDVLIDEEDLLSQLSSQLDIPSFVDQGETIDFSPAGVREGTLYCRSRQQQRDSLQPASH